MIVRLRDAWITLPGRPASARRPWWSDIPPRLPSASPELTGYMSAGRSASSRPVHDAAAANTASIVISHDKPCLSSAGSFLNVLLE